VVAVVGGIPAQLAAQLTGNREEAGLARRKGTLGLKRQTVGRGCHAAAVIIRPAARSEKGDERETRTLHGMVLVGAP